jgi:hypothetical protein
LTDLLCKQGVAGSNPVTSTNLFNHLCGSYIRYLLSQQGVNVTVCLNLQERGIARLQDACVHWVHNPMVISPDLPVARNWPEKNLQRKVLEEFGQ